MTFIDCSVINEAFKAHNSKRGPKGFTNDSLLTTLITMQIDKIPTIKALERRLKTDPIFRVTCGFEIICKTPSTITFSRFIAKLSATNILEKTFLRMVLRAKTLGLIDGTNVSIDATKIDAFEYAVNTFES